MVRFVHSFYEKCDLRCYIEILGVKCHVINANTRIEQCEIDAFSDSFFLVLVQSYTITTGAVPVR
jgi:hypothetical protein